ncbi:unnamed protein product [Olea europaea subsp. europaea]|uniref:Unnamed protein product n=1 Tax=Olea europaea subsp. europaea TaxID=158383 RepID=A0A8S0UG35_OLEEU|nr:unnamed protein product [Olea europaea subsp. europaea]
MVLFIKRMSFIKLGAAQEALPQAAAPEEVAHPDPDQEERAALLLEVQTLIIEQLQEESKKAQGVRLPVLFPEMREVDSSAARNSSCPF